MSTALATVVASFVITVTLVDFSIWSRYLNAVPEFVARPAGSVTAYQTTLGFARRLCVAEPEWNPTPALDCARAAYAVPTLLIAGAVAVTLALARKSPVHLWAAAGLCLSELSLPIAAESHFMLFAAALALLPIGRLPLSLFAVLYLVPLAITAEAFTSGWSILAAYPRLYAAWLLWALVILAMRQAANATGPTWHTTAALTARPHQGERHAPAV